MKRILLLGFLCGIVASCPALVTADEQNGRLSADASSDTRHGLFNWLDTRSEYGQGVFPEPFLVDDSDLEPGEARLDWLHTQAAGSSKTDVMTAEVEKAFGMITLELEVPYEFDRGGGVTTRGFDNIDFGARCPIHQFVSQNGFVDSTTGVGIEVGIPTESVLSKNAEFVPKIFNDLKVGNLTAQSVLGYSALFGPGEEGGVHTFEYGFVFGYTIPHDAIQIPAVQEVIPFFELVGETELNKSNPGHTSLLGNAGLRLNMQAIGRMQPRPGIGFLFPIDSGAREETHWGVITSLVFQF